MKKLIWIPLLCLFGCEAIDKQIKECNDFYGGRHLLRKFSSQEKVTPSSASASYFLVWGSASYKGEEKESYIAFSWKSKTGEYILSKVPMEKVRVKFDNSAKVPYVTISISGCEGNNPNNDLLYIMEYRLNYVVVHCKETDYPTDINVNDLK